MGTRKEQWDRAAYDLDEAKEYWSNVAGTLRHMELGFKPKKPDWKKVQKLLQKAKKPGKYFLVMTELVLTFELHVGGAKLILDRFDVAKVKGTQNQRDVLRKLQMRTKVVTKDDLVRFDKENADPEDGAEAVSINEQLDALGNEIDWLKQTAKAGNFRSKDAVTGLFMNKEFRAWAKKKRFSVFTEFLVDAQSDRGWTKNTLALVQLGKRSGLKSGTLGALEAARDAGERPDFTAAEREVGRIVNTVLLPKYNKEGLSDLVGKIKKKEAERKTLLRKLRALKAA